MGTNVLPLLWMVLSGAVAYALNPPSTPIQEFRAEQRTSMPVLGKGPFGVIAVRVRNESDQPVGSVLVDYRVQLAESWHGPGSVPPITWQPPLYWMDRRFYCDVNLPSGATACVACDEREGAHGVQFQRVQLGHASFKQTLPFDGRLIYATVILMELGIWPEWREPAVVLPDLTPETLHAHLVRRDEKPDPRAWTYKPMRLEGATPAHKDQVPGTDSPMGPKNAASEIPLAPRAGHLR